MTENFAVTARLTIILKGANHTTQHVRKMTRFEIIHTCLTSCLIITGAPTNYLIVAFLTHYILRMS